MEKDEESIVKLNSKVQVTLNSKPFIFALEIIFDLYILIVNSYSKDHQNVRIKYCSIYDFK